MKTTQTIQLRIFGVRIRDERTGEVRKDKITFTKLIRRAYNRAGYRVLGTIWAEKREVVLDLEELWNGLYSDEQGAPLDLIDILKNLEAEEKAADERENHRGQ